MKLGKFDTKSISGRWKIAVLVVVLLLIAGGISYAIISRNTDAVEAVSASNKLSNENNNSCAVPNTPDMSDLNWVKNLKDSFANSDFVFIFIEGSNDDANKKAQDVISGAYTLIQDQGVDIAHVSIDKQNPEYSVTVSRLSTMELPVVFEVNRNGSGMIVPSEITETKILQAFLTLVKACAPGSSCCP